MRESRTAAQNRRFKRTKRLMKLRQVIPLLICSTSLGQIPPDCVFAGREYSGATGDFDDISSTCPRNIGQVFSLAFTARPDTLVKWHRFVDFGEENVQNNVFCAVSDALKMTCVSNSLNNGIFLTKRVDLDEPLVAGVSHRYLLIVKADQTAELRRDDGLYKFKNYFPVAEVPRTKYIAKSHWAGEGYLDGLVKEVWIWYRSVDPVEAFMTTTKTISSTSTTTVSMTRTISTMTMTTSSKTSMSWTTTTKTITGTGTTITGTKTTLTTTATSTTTVTGTSTTMTKTNTTVTATATTATTTTTTVTVTTVTVTTTITAVGFNTLEAGVDAAIGSGASKLGDDSSVDFDGDLGAGRVLNLDKLKADVPNAPVDVRKGVKLGLSHKFLASLPPGAKFATLNMDGGRKQGKPVQDAFPQDAELPNGGLLSDIVDLTILDANGNKITKLPEPLLFKLPTKVKADLDETACAYIKNGVWARDGVRRATDDEVEEVGGSVDDFWCAADHLSIFAVLLEALLGCTNVELLSEGGIWAIANHDGWWRTDPSLLTIVVLSIISIMWMLGVGHEIWSGRLGYTHQAAKQVQICQNFLTMGPQILKHRYVAFLVYAKDIFHCLRSGRENLRLPTLKQGIQRCLAVRTWTTVTAVQQHCWAGGKWIEAKASLPLTVVCHKLQFHSGLVEYVIENDLRGRGPLAMLRRFVMMFIACHPFLDALRLGTHSMSVRKRATLQLASFLGVLAANAMIFNFSGANRSWEADATCPISPSSQFFLIVATCISVLLNVIPNQFLTNVAKQIHGRQGWKILFWAMLTIYLGWSTFLCMLALANLNSRDQDKWFASMRWSLIIKFLGMPMMQTLRNWIALEHFLHEDSQSNHIVSSLGLKHPMEEALPKEKLEEAEHLAVRAISAEELVKFTALLGEKVMMDYVPGKSTSEEVLHGAIQHFCKDNDHKDEALKIQMIEVDGLPKEITSNCELGCAVFNLGPLNQDGLHRSCVQLCQSSIPAIHDSNSESSPAYEVSLAGWDEHHAIGFAVIGTSNRVFGMGFLTLEEVMKNNGYDGQVRLFQPQGSGVLPTAGKSITTPSHAPDESGAHVSVKIEVPPAFAESLMCHQLKSLRVDDTLPKEDSNEVVDDNNAKPGKGKAYCTPIREVHLPADRLVVHSMEGTFLDFCATLLADALGDKTGSKGAFEAMQTSLLQRDFNSILEALQREGKMEVRFWVDFFAVDYEGGSKQEWHEKVFAAMPTVARRLRRLCCNRMVADIEGMKDPQVDLPAQVVVLDKRAQVLRDSGSLAEVMQVGAMGLSQRMALHPDHLNSTVLADSLRELNAKEPASDASKFPWTAPYTANREKVHSTVKDLIVQSVRKQGDEEKLKDLGLTDVAATIAGDAAARAEAGDAAPRPSVMGDQEGGEAAGGDIGDIGAD